MKNENLITFCLMLVISNNSNAQLFNQLFNKAKQSLTKTVNKEANRLLDDALESASEKAGNIAIVSRKIKNNNANAKVQTPKFVEDKKSMIPVAEVDNFLAHYYPKFYKIYLDVQKDPLTEEIIFVTKDEHTFIANSTRSGKIVFDLYYFEDITKPKEENFKIWLLLRSQGGLHYYKESNNQENIDFYNFNYALHKAREYAEKSDCNALKFAFNGWKSNKLPTTSKREARDKIINSEYYKECELWYQNNSKNCSSSNDSSN